MTTWGAVSRDDLLQWADSSEGPAQLPYLIRRLIRETGNQVSAAHIPAGSGVSIGGLDGLVLAAGRQQYVPEGTSVWEFSTKKASQAKATSDYNKRTSVPGGTPVSESTYIQVSCRPWTKCQRWAEDRTAECRWKAVKAYNVDDIEDWLETAPGTRAWFLELRGRPMDGIQTATDWWAGWLASTTQPLDEEVLLAGREHQAEELIRRATSGPGVLTIGGDVRVDEIKGFLAACAARSAKQDIPRFAEQLLFIDNEHSLRRVLKEAHSLTLMVNSANLAETLTAGPHRILVPVTASARGDIVLPLVSNSKITTVLTSRGVDFHLASDLGYLGRRSILALRRRLAVKPEIHSPTWAAPGADSVIRRALLLHSWNDAWEGDRRVVSELTGMDFESTAHRLIQLRELPHDPMISTIDGNWHVVSPVDAWLLLAHQLNRTDLEKFRMICLTVLGEIDPVLDLAQENRWRAGIDGIRHQYSPSLRKGLAKTLALLGTFGDSVQTGSGTTGETWARRIVAELLKTANEDSSLKTWTSLGPVLSLLAEAGPTPFVAALEGGLRGSPPLLANIFTDSSRDQFGSPHSSPHTFFLWALETLAWSPEHFTDAMSLLAHLATLDPGGEWSNRPSASLAQTFFPVHPNTSATAEQRLATIDRLRRRFPDVAWELMFALLPNGRGFQMIHRGPDYRNWKQHEELSISRGEYRQFISAVTERLIADLGSVVSRHIALIKRLHNLPSRQREEFLDLLNKQADGMPEEEKASLWNELRSFAADQREFPDANWTLSESELSKVDLTVASLRPSLATVRHRWLFGNGVITIGDATRRDDYVAYAKLVSDHRRDAVSDILGQEGFAETVAFAGGCEAPDIVGVALAQATRDPRYDHLLVEMLDDESEKVAALALGYFGQRMLEESDSWLDQILTDHSEASPLSKARLLRATRSPESWKRAEDLGADVWREYWTEFSYFGLGENLNYLSYIARQLTDVNRPSAALDLLAMYSHSGQESADHAVAIADSLEGLMARGKSPDPEFRLLHSYDFDALFRVLSNHRESMGASRIVRLEWYFLPALGHEPNARTLHQTLAEDPVFFVEMIKMAFRSKSREPQNDFQNSEVAQQLAENAYTLLSSWSVCPGKTPDGTLDQDGLRAWVTEARRLLAEADRAEIGEQFIGEALASAPAGSDGIAPCPEVRELLEEWENRDIETGLEIRIYNNRGVVTRDPQGGGDLERSAASKYREQEEALRDRWPRTARIFRYLADSYEAEAKGEDSQSERFRRGLDW